MVHYETKKTPYKHTTFMWKVFILDVIYIIYNMNELCTTQLSHILVVMEYGIT